MSGWTLVGFAAFFVAALATGVRLVLLWRRTGELPELLIGLGVLGIGPLGFGFAVLAQLPGSAAAGLGALLYGTGILAMNAGGAAKFVFNWRVYHPDRGWARAAACAGIALLALATLWEIARIAGAVRLGGFLPPAEISAAAHVGNVLRIVCLGWGAGEAFRWFGRMRRRGRLGLADPAVTDRFLLWGIAAGAAALGSLVGTAVPLVLGVPPLEIGWLTTSSSLHGLVAAVAMWLAFLPPRPYLRWLASRRAAS